MADYITEKLIGGKYTTQEVKFALDTYYPGMPLEYDAVNNRYQYLAAGVLAGFFGEPESRAILADGWGTVISSGEIQEQGIVTDTNTAYTVDEDFIAIARAARFDIKRN